MGTSFEVVIVTLGSAFKFYCPLVTGDRTGVVPAHTCYTDSLSKSDFQKVRLFWGGRGFGRCRRQHLLRKHGFALG